MPGTSAMPDHSFKLEENNNLFSLFWFLKILDFMLFWHCWITIHFIEFKSALFKNDTFIAISALTVPVWWEIVTSESFRVFWWINLRLLLDFLEKFGNHLPVMPYVKLSFWIFFFHAPLINVPLNVLMFHWLVGWLRTKANLEKRFRSFKYTVYL